jgi:hypothetical protein
MNTTPGPWHIKKLGKQMYIESHSKNGSGGFVCDMQRGEAMHEDYEYIDADAHLIAAAPELLDCLRFLLNPDNCAIAHAKWGEGCNREEVSEMLSKAKLAIAKADGRDQ